MEFENRKAAALASLGSPEADKSPKGTLDAPIIPLINTLNNHPSYFTTSSCSGRISILSQPIIKLNPSTTSPNPRKKKALGGSWLFITHDPADPDAVLSLFFTSDSTQTLHQHPPSELVFRFEPLIVAVECKDLPSAQSLVSLAISSGFRESGITSVSKRVIIAIRCSIRLELPLGTTQKILVSPEYLRYLVGVANDKMEANKKRTEGFLRALLTNGFVGLVGMSMVKEDENCLACGSGVACDGGLDGENDSNGRDENACSGSTGASHCNLSVIQMLVPGEPVEKLFLWGHSACTLDNQVLVFGGFGGLGRHARRNSLLLLDPYSGTLKRCNLEGVPSPRLGHTSCLVGDNVFIIGGRADPQRILSDVWVLDTTKNACKLLDCSGDAFPPRHRHAAAVVGSKIYVFGGLNNDTISSSFHVLNTDSLQWKELSVTGDLPCARHSHTMVAWGSQLFLFGGYNGEKALGDFYSFDIKTCQWKKDTLSGRSPHARFSHSMFVYKDSLGIIGGCPVRQHFEELAMLDLRSRIWRHFKLDSAGKGLFVRSTANVVGDDLVIVGGGAACYAFGTKFSEPMKINLIPFMLWGDNYKTGPKIVTHQTEARKSKGKGEFQDVQTKSMEIITKVPALNNETELHVPNGIHQQLDSLRVLRLERKYAKMGKDIMKKFGWIDLGRKVYSSEDGMHICFPVNPKFCNLFHEKKHSAVDASEGPNDLSKQISDEKSLSNEVTRFEAMDILKEYGATNMEDDVAEERKTAKSPLKAMNEAITSLIKDKGLPLELLEELPTRWERLGDIVVLPVSSFKNPVWDSTGEELWPVIAKSLNAQRLARQGRVAPTGTRDSALEILVGDGGWVNHRENGVHYSFDATKCMFSWGNLSEKLRMAQLDCRDEVIVDLFAGIGYFVLPFLVGAKAKFVYACEWNPHAVDALKHNLQSNFVSDRCVVLEGDNKITAPKAVADRVCLGLLPSSEGSWTTAIRALRYEGGILHVHGNVKDSEESFWTEYVSNSILEIAKAEGYSWEVCVQHIERVKWYAPHIRHVVADISCRPTQK